MIFNTPFNNLIAKFIFKSNQICIKGRSKLRVKDGAKLIFKDKKSSLTLGFGDSTTASFLHSGINFNLMKNSICEIDGKVIVGLNSAITVEDGARLAIGDKTYIGAKAHFRVGKNVEIGKNVAIAWNVTIMDSDFHDYFVNDKNKNIAKDVIIKDNVWIGNNVIILKGVTIGESAIVGAGSVVTRDIKANTAVAGNPAKVIKENVRPRH